MSQADEGRESTPAYRSTGPLADEPPAPTYAAPVEPPPRRGGSGFLGGLIGGLLGTAAVLAGAGWYAYERGPIRPTLERLASTETAARDAQARVGGLGGEIQQLRSGMGGELQAASGSLGQLDQRVGALDARLAANEAATGELAATVEQANTAVRVATDDMIGRLEAVNTRLAEMARTQPADIVDKGTVEEIAGKQAAIEQAQQRLEGSLARAQELVAGGLQSSNQQAEALRVVVDDSRTRLDGVAAGVLALTALRDEVGRQQAADAELGQALQAVSAQQRQAAEATGQQVAAVRADLERRLEEVVTRLGELDKQRERSVGMSLAVDSLNTAMQTGEPLQPTLELLGQLAGEDPAVGEATAKLQPAAADGVATMAELAQQLAAVEGSLSAPEEAAPDDLLAQTRANLGSLVDLHPADAEPVPGVGAVQAAREAVLRQDLEGAVQALQPLVGAGNQEASAWIGAATTRLDAGAALETLRQHVKTLLARQD